MFYEEHTRALTENIELHLLRADVEFGKIPNS